MRFPRILSSVFLASCSLSGPVDPTIDAGADGFAMVSDAGSDAGDPNLLGPIVEARECGMGSEWCWAHGAPVTVVDGASSSALYAGGLNGAFFRWSDAGWEPVLMPAYDDVTDIYVASPVSIWVAAGVLWHFDGTNWRLSDDSPACRSLVGNGAESVWAYGGCTPAHHDGVQWTEYPLPTEDADATSMLVRDGFDTYATLLRTEGPDVEVIVRLEGSEWRQVGDAFEVSRPSLGAPWQRRVAELDGEIVTFTGGTTGFRLVGDNWQPLRVFPFPEGSGPLQYSNRSGFQRVSPRCASYSARGGLAVQLADGEAFCTNYSELLRRVTDEWIATPYDEYTGTLSAERWGDVPVQLWASDAEGAWGSGPNNVLRVRTLPPSEYRDEISHYDGTTWRVVGNFGFETELTDFASAGNGMAWLVFGAYWPYDRSLQLFDGRELVQIEPPPELGVEFVGNAHGFPNGEAFFTASVTERWDSEWVLLRHFEGEWTTVRRWSATNGDFFLPVDIAGDSPETLRITGWTDERALVLVERDEGRWTETLRLPDAEPGSEYSVDADSIWFGTRRLPTSPLEEAMQLPGIRGTPTWRAVTAPGDTFRNLRPPTVWVDETRVWVISRGKAMFRFR